MYSLDDLNVRCKAVAVPTPHCDRDQLWSRAFSAHRPYISIYTSFALQTFGIWAHIHPLRTSCVHTVLTFLFCARTLLLLLLYVHDIEYKFVLYRNFSYYWITWRENGKGGGNELVSSIDWLSMSWASSVSIFVFLLVFAILPSGICISDVFGVVLDCSAVAEGGIERVSAGRERGRVPPCKKVRSPLSNTSSTMYVDHCARYISYIHDCNYYKFKYITTASACRNCTSHSLQKSIVQNSFFSLLQHICKQKRIFLRTVYVLWIDLFSFHLYHSYEDVAEGLVNQIFYSAYFWPTEAFRGKLYERFWSGLHYSHSKDLLTLLVQC